MYSKPLLLIVSCLFTHDKQKDMAFYENDYFDLSDLSDLWPINETDDYYDFEDDTQCITCEIELVLIHALPPILLLIGLPGNLLALITMRTLSREAFPLCGYMCLISVLDTVLLFMETGNEWMSLITHINILTDVTTYSDTMCKLYNFLLNLIVHHDVWILVILLIECEVLLHDPEKIRYITSRRVLDTLAFVAVLLICANCHYFWTYGINSVVIPGMLKPHQVCQFQTRTLDGQIIYGTPPTAVLWTTLHNVLATILPSVVFLVLLALYIRRRRVYNASKYTDDLSEHIQERRSKNRENQANGLPYDRSGVLLNAVFICEISLRSFPVLAGMFLLCYSPDYIHTMLEQRLGHLGSPDLWNLTGIILHKNRSIFYSCKILVFAATSSVFRKTLKLTLVKKWNSLKNNCSLAKRHREPARDQTQQTPPTLRYHKI